MTHTQKQKPLRKSKPPSEPKTAIVGYFVTTIGFICTGFQEIIL